MKTGEWKWPRLVQRSLRHRSVRLGEWLTNTSYTKKWLVLASAVGVIAGLGAITFYEALHLATYWFVQVLAGYHQPLPYAEGSVHASSHFVRPWAIPLLAASGALGGAVLVAWVAPDAEGHGTDAAIAAVHHNPRGVRLRTVAVKIVASALTIGSGGSGGREGPTGQISAGFGSFLARLLDLRPADARITVASGIGSGIGAIFGAPLGGAILATEILYRDDFEVEALLPSIFSSTVAYGVWGSVEGFGPLFGFVKNYHLTSATPLLWFAFIGVAGGLVGLLYAKGFYFLARLFARLSIARWLRPALGGLLVGLLALAIPEVLGTGYGWIQIGLSSELTHIPLWIVLVLPFARILSTGLSIGSGGSGGIFGPGMVIGAFVGAATWRLLEPVVPSMGHDPAPYVIVGMVACFGSISRAPLAVLLMVAEMTGTLSLVVPAMVAVGLATLIVRRNDDTIYRSQLRSRDEAPAHQILAGLPLLAMIEASQAMAPAQCVLTAPGISSDYLETLLSRGVSAAPLVDAGGHYLGVITNEALGGLTHRVVGHDVEDLIDGRFAPVTKNTHLDTVLEILTTATQTWAPVIDDERHVVGTIAISDIVRNYRRAAQANVARAAARSGETGVIELTVSATSPLVDTSLRAETFPRGTLITSLERGTEVLRPTGDTTLRAGDRLLAVGPRSELERLATLVTS